MDFHEIRGKISRIAGLSIIGIVRIWQKKDGPGIVGMMVFDPRFPE